MTEAEMAMLIGEWIFTKMYEVNCIEYVKENAFLANYGKRKEIFD